jgi:exodeoxyribonuclease VII small subunit
LRPETSAGRIPSEARVAIRKMTASTDPSKSDSPDDPGEDQSFEASIRRLGEIVDALEGGELPLEDSLRLFEEGVKLARASQAKLDGAEKRVEELLSVDENGNPVVREIDVE